MSKPSILLVTGSFCRPNFYDNVVDAVTAKGYEMRALHSPSVGLETGPREGAPPTMYDDAAFIAGEVEKLADAGKDVIIMGHSYGGVPMTESVKGLSKAERQKQGKKGGVVRLAYMTCLVPPVGGSAASVLAEVSEYNKLDLKIDEKGWMYHDPIEATAALVFSALSKEEGVAYSKQFVQHSAISFAGELTYPGYKDVPVSYLFCENDLTIPADVQKAGIDLIEKESGNKVDVTSIKADHCPNVSAIQETVDWTLHVAAQS